MHTLTRRSLLGTAASATATLGVCLPRWAHAAEFTYKYGGNLPEAHPLSHRIAEAAAAIARETDGRVAIRVFPNSQLGGDTAMIRDLQSGRLEFMTVSGLILSTLVPVASISGIGYAFANYGEVWAALDGLVGAQIRDAITAGGLHPFERMFDSGYRQVTSASRPIREPADFQGMKFRVPDGPLWSSMFQAFGASPVAINFADAYAALKRKTVEGQENPLAVINAAKLFEVQTYCSMTNHMWDGYWFIANQQAWSALPPSLQDIISRHINDAALVERAEVRALNDSLQDELEGHGMVFNRPDPAPFRNTLRQAGFYDDWRAKYGPEAWQLLESSVGSLG